MNVKTVSCQWLSSAAPVDEELLREMLSFDMLCSKSIQFERDKFGHAVFKLPPSSLHWSRVWEWPWAIRAVPLAGKHVLNAGGGHSVMTCSLAKRCHWVMVVDLDEDSLNHVRKQVPFVSFPNTSTIKADLTELDKKYWVDGFDTVYCISVLEHIPDWKKAVLEMLRVLQPGGKLVLTCDCEIIPEAGYKGPPESCPHWNLLGLGTELLQLLGVYPDTRGAMIGKVEDKFYMILAAVLEKQP